MVAPARPMVSVPVQPLTAIRADLQLAGVRWLGPGDGPLLVALLRACYGYTYSYADLYRPETSERLWASGELSSLGYLDADGRLAGHTGFWRKDPRGEYVESGLSLVHPAARRGFPVDAGQLWRALRASWSRETGFIHQNTTTRHSRAQLYAIRYMRARPTGVIVEYALGERVVGLAEAPAPMHALTMTTVLEAGPAQTLALPSGPWATWLAQVIAGVLPSARVVPAAGAPVACGLEPIEWNASLGLRRRAITLAGGSGSLPEELAAPSRAGVRTELIHLPLRPALVAGAWDSLLAAGYLPVGIRPHRRRTTELVLQQLGDRSRCERAVAAMELPGASLRRFVEGWWEACARTS